MELFGKGHRWWRLPVDCDLTVAALWQAISLYREHHEHRNPTTLVVPSEMTFAAYEILQKANVNTLLVVPVPGMPTDSWMVCASDGGVFSPGA